MKARLSTRRSGFTLVELLVSSVVMSLGLLTVAGMLYLNNSAQKKISNKVDAITSAHVAIERIARDVRMGSTLGDIYGNRTAIIPPTVPPSYITKGSATFPSNADWFYGPGGTAPAGFQGWPNSAALNWDTHGNSYSLSAQTLIVQVPIFDSNNPQPPAGGPYGFPTEIKKDTIAVGRPAFNQPNVETHIYEIVLDPDQVNHPNEYILLTAKLPGYQIPSVGAPNIYNPANVTTKPQVLCTGIVGPVRAGTGPMATAGNPPLVFMYVNKATPVGTQPGQAMVPPLADDDIPDYTGIVVNLEIRKQAAGQSKAAFLPLKQEIFLRNNAEATPTGQAEAVSGIDPL
jgi:prepilin-type N-terminal cleavage/methylation domain-containing protein